MFCLIRAGHTLCNLRICEHIRKRQRVGKNEAKCKDLILGKENKKKEVYREIRKILFDFLFSNNNLKIPQQ